MASALKSKQTNITTMKNKKTKDVYQAPQFIAAVLRSNFESGYLLAAKREERRMFSQAIFCFDQKNLLR